MLRLPKHSCSLTQNKLFLPGKAAPPLLLTGTRKVMFICKHLGDGAIPPGILKLTRERHTAVRIKPIQKSSLGTPPSNG